MEPEAKPYSRQGSTYRESFKMRSPTAGAVVAPEDAIDARKILEEEIVRSSSSSREPIPAGMIHPEATGKKWWDTLVLVLLVHAVTILPFQVAFYRVDPHSLFVLQVVIDSLWGLDILLTFRTAFYKDGVLVSDPATVARAYLHSWLAIDVLATFPIYVLAPETTVTKLSRVARLPRLFKVVRMLRLIRVLRLRRLSSYIQHMEMVFSVNGGVVRMAKFAFIALVMQHWISCAWFLAADLGDFNPETWVFRRFCGQYAARDCISSMQTNSTLLDEFGCSAAERDIVAEECAIWSYGNTFSVYLDGFYFALSALTTVGFGDVSAYTDIERLFAVGIMLIGVSFYAFTIGNLSAILSSIDSERAAFRKRVDTLNEFVKANKLPLPVQVKLRNYFAFSYTKRKLTKDQRAMILSELPPSLRYLVLFHTHRELIGTIRFLALKDPALVTELVSHMLPSRFEPADMLFLEGDFSAEIFFVTSGSVVVTLEGEDGGESAVEITAGHAVGQEAALYQHYECTARAAAACEVQGIMRETLRRVRSQPGGAPPPSANADHLAPLDEIRKIGADFPTLFADLRTEHTDRMRELRRLQRTKGAMEGAESGADPWKAFTRVAATATVLDKWKKLGKSKQKSRVQRLDDRTRDIGAMVDKVLSEQAALSKRLDEILELLRAKA